FQATRRPPSTPLFPYTTLFRSLQARATLATVARLLGTRVQESLALARAVGATADEIRQRLDEQRPRVEERQAAAAAAAARQAARDRNSTRLNSSHVAISYAVFC